MILIFHLSWEECYTAISAEITHKNTKRLSRKKSQNPTDTKRSANFLYDWELQCWSIKIYLVDQLTSKLGDQYRVLQTYRELTVEVLVSEHLGDVIAWHPGHIEKPVGDVSFSLLGWCQWCTKDDEVTYHLLMTSSLPGNITISNR